MAINFDGARFFDSLIEIVVARAYPITVADRATLREWLSALRNPGVGGI